jgi:hypothetical protein
MRHARNAVRTCAWLLWIAAATGGCQFEPTGQGGGSDVGDGPAGDGGIGGPDASFLDDGVELVADDPFGDGTAFAHVIGHAGEIYLGPSQDGDRLLRIDPGPVEVATLSFARDQTGNQSGNAGTPPYSGIGYAGCSPDGDCGPDDEDGRGLFASGVAAASDVLVAGGARSAGDLDYLYLTRDTGTALSFRYVDLSAVMGPASKGFSALHVFRDRIYAGVPDTGGARPYLVALYTVPAEGAGLDAAEGTDVDNLDADNMPGLKTASNAIIDDIADFAGLLYLANAGGWMRSTSDQPRSYELAPEDWSPTTPSSPDYTARASIATDKTAGLTPADRAVPAFAVHRGRLYAARNTIDGPQLWSCDPTLTEPAAACDAGDWQLIAANQSGDTGLSQLGNSDSSAISLLVSTGAHLYVGYDNPGGLRLFRSAAEAPTLPGDFEAVGRAGLGTRSATRILDGQALGAAGDELYLVIGDGTSPVRVVRVTAP